MGLETGTYVSDLNTSNPVNGDPVSQGAAHLRLIKTVLQATFPDAEAPIYGLRSAGVKNLTGTSVSFTDIPSWVKRITITFSGLSLSGSAVPLLRIGDADGIETAGYTASAAHISIAGATSADNLSSAFLLVATAGATASISGTITLTLHNPSTNTWTLAGNSIFSSGTVVTAHGIKSLSATLTQLQFGTTNGTDTFDAGTVNIHYE
jgi:hypothetical protein